MIIIKDSETNEIIGRVVTNQSLSFDRIMALAGFAWKTHAKDGVECDGWYNDDVLLDETSVEFEHE